MSSGTLLPQHNVNAWSGNDGIEFTCGGCTCKSKRLNVGLLDFVDCRGSQLGSLPIFPPYFVSEVCDMSGTPYCTDFDNEDHEATNSQFILIICESG